MIQGEGIINHLRRVRAVAEIAVEETVDALVYSDLIDIDPPCLFFVILDDVLEKLNKAGVFASSPFEQ